MLQFIACIAIILFVLQAQVDLLVSSPNNRLIKIILFVLAVVAVLFQRYG